MLLQKEVVAYLAGHIISSVSPAMVEVAVPAAAKEALVQVILHELSVEDQLNDEVREILSQYSEYMRREQVSFQDMFRKVKNQLIQERKIVRVSGDGMKLSRDKITDISHKVIGVMRRGREFRMKRPENDIRLSVVKTFTDFLQAEDRIDKAAKAKVKSQKREILEGSEEFDILHRRYYAEELKKIGIDLARS